MHLNSLQNYSEGFLECAAAGRRHRSHLLRARSMRLSAVLTVDALATLSAEPTRLIALTVALHALRLLTGASLGQHRPLALRL